MRFSRCLLALLTAFTAFTSPSMASDDPAHVLVFSHSSGFRHESIEAGVAALQALGERYGMTVIASKDPALFDGDQIQEFDAIVLLSNSSQPDDPASEWWVGARRDSLQAFVRAGGGIVAIHAASDSHYHWPWYGQMIGGRFASHPPGTPEGEVTLTDSEHPANHGLASPHRRVDEWYYFDDYNPTMDLLATLDPASIEGEDVNPNPAAWAHEFDGGRIFYTAMGHTAESFSEPWFLQHLEGGLSWVLED